MRRSQPFVRRHRFSRALAVIRFLIVSVISFIRGIALLITGIIRTILRSVRSIIRTHQVKRQQYRSRYGLYRLMRHSRRDSRALARIPHPNIPKGNKPHNPFSGNPPRQRRGFYPIIIPSHRVSDDRSGGRRPRLPQAGDATVRHGAAQRRQTRAKRGSDLIENTQVKTPTI